MTALAEELDQDDNNSSTRTSSSSRNGDLIVRCTRSTGASRKEDNMDETEKCCSSSRADDNGLCTTVNGRDDKMTKPTGTGTGTTTTNMFSFAWFLGWFTTSSSSSSTTTATVTSCGPPVLKFQGNVNRDNDDDDDDDTCFTSSYCYTTTASRIETVVNDNADTGKEESRKIYNSVTLMDRINHEPEDYEAEHNQHDDAGGGDDDDDDDAVSASWEKEVVPWVLANHDYHQQQQQDFRANNRNTTLWPLPPPPPTELTPIQQLENWDCGIVCLQMVVSWLLTQHDQSACSALQTTTADVASPALMMIDTRAWFLDKAQTQSIWTIDLVYLLDQFVSTLSIATTTTVRSLFCSTSLHVNDAWTDLDYYSDTFRDDKVRVSQRLHHLLQRQQEQEASSHNDNRKSCIRLLQREHISIEQIIRFIQSESCIAIALVDNSVLLQQNHHLLDDDDHIASNITGFQDGTNATADNHQTALPSASVYAGHYIILAGVVVEDDESSSNTTTTTKTTSNKTRPTKMWLHVYNPATGMEQELPLALFERAWRASGTDCDILFIAR